MAEDYRYGLDPKWGLNDDDVVTNNGYNMVKFKTLMHSIMMWTQKLSGDWTSPMPEWFSSKGFEIQVLRLQGGGWQKGKLRFRLEFIPDNPEAFIEQPSPEPSHLDDLRSDLNIK